MSLLSYVPPLLDDGPDIERQIAKTEEAVLQVFREISAQLAALAARVERLEQQR